MFRIRNLIGLQDIYFYKNIILTLDVKRVSNYQTKINMKSLVFEIKQWKVFIEFKPEQGID